MNENQPVEPDPVHYKEAWAIEDKAKIKHLEDEVVYFTERLQRHCFNPPVYSTLAKFIEDLRILIKKEKDEYEQSYGQAYNRPSG